MEQAPTSNEWLVAAHLLRSQGRRGELLAEAHVPFALFSAGRAFWLAKPGIVEPAENTSRSLEEAWQPVGKNAGRVVLKLAGIETISEAELLNGRSLLLRATDLPALDEDTFRVRDLVGCSLFDRDRLVGEIVEIQFPVAADGRTRLEDAPDLLAVLPVGPVQPVCGPIHDAAPSAQEDAETVLVPFVRAWLLKVDTGGKRIDMQLPPGLFGTLDAE